jgi:phosphatidylglycerol---prolipoprotein diacylglyceryl transferase
MLPVLQIGPLAIRTSTLLLLLGFYFGLSLAERRLTKGGPTSDQLYTLTFISVFAGILAARLSFAAQNFNIFRESPLIIFSLDTSLLDPFGGTAVALIGMLIYGQRKKLSFWLTLDSFTPLLAVFAVFLGLAHTTSGAAYGAPTSLPWGIDLWGAKRHLSQVYETLAALLILVLFWPRFGREDAPGNVFLLFIMASAGTRLVLEAWRGDSIIIVGGVRLAQVIAWLVIALGFWLLERKARANL